MRSSTSRFRPALIYVAATLALAAWPYAHWVALAPMAEDRLAEAFAEPDPVEAGGVALFRAECLAGSLIRPEEYCERPGLTAEDRPFAFVDTRLLAPDRPKRVVVLEDSTFFLFAQRGAAESPGRAAESPRPAAAPVVAAPRPLGLDEYLTTSRQRKEVGDQEFRRGPAQASLADPLVLRRLLAEGAGYLLHQVTPALVTPSRFASHLVAGYFHHLAKGDDRELVSAWKAYRMTLPAPHLRAWLRDHFLGQMTIASYPQPMDGPGSCFDLSFVDPARPPAAPYDRYPVVAALKRAQAEGAAISVVLLPFNEHVERQCAEAYRPFLAALMEVAVEAGWPVRDLRASNTPELAALGNFTDRFHLIMPDNPRFRREFSRQFAAAAGLRTRDACPP